MGQQGVEELEDLAGEAVVESAETGQDTVVRCSKMSVNAGH